ncbi:hypothetical protein QBC46DRAFT_421216 [Diplogelasinospora grovesii]|uniref:F-box domain-containing protein n=1 Tax=Diplogelasinospora grovesii TaxID=303347 RepID=A0AAN6N1M4_9PEZI|nr:hypothetical protein QBC46DRAFT_421216 [Diplogelasinospora grovesii]
MPSSSSANISPLMKLPPEMLDEICGHLCLHCRCPSGYHGNGQYMVGLPVEVISTGREGKATLSRLSRTCRRLRDIAQPYVFHYHHSGIQPRMIHGPQSHTSQINKMVHSVPSGTIDPLLPFLRSLLDNRKLAEHVKALSLHQGWYDWGRENFRYVGKHDSLKNVFKERYRWSFEPRWNASAEASGFSGVRYYKQLAINLVAPFLQELLLSAAGSWVLDWRDIRNSNVPLGFVKPNMPRLTYMAVVASPCKIRLIAPKETVTWEIRDYHFQSLHHLLSKAPNLRVLEAADCGEIWRRDPWHPLYNERDSLPGPQPRDKSWDVAMSNLRKLSVNSLKPDFIAKILLQCPALVDLEAWTDGAIDGVLTKEQLSPLEKRLRRFSHSVAKPSVYASTCKYTRERSAREVAIDLCRQIESERSDRFEAAKQAARQARRPQPEREQIPTHLPMSFASFSCLEILEVEYLLLYFEHLLRDYGSDDLAKIPNSLLGLLPPSLEVLHIGMITGWGGTCLRRDLWDLVLERPGQRPQASKLPNLRQIAPKLPNLKQIAPKLPNLKQIILDFYVVPKPDEIKSLRNMLRNAGISLEVRDTPMSDSARGMMGERPGHPTVNVQRPTRPCLLEWKKVLRP